MKERPILFSAPMVRALLAGTKTQTRRVVSGLSKRFPLVNLADVAPSRFSGRFDDPASWGWAYAEDGAHAPLASWLTWCPYGQPGDRLWVRERHAPAADCWGAWGRRMDGDSSGPDPVIHYAADGGDPFVERWRPSIHMPRWASRITLEVGAVRVERLQDISEADAVAEGVYTDPAAPAYDAYRMLWEQINGAGSWATNPWVWVVEFRQA